MSKRLLTSVQRKFLEYLVNEHNCVGMGSVITSTLTTGQYDVDAMKKVVHNFNCLVNELRTGKNTHEYCHIGTYHKPTKYLK